MQVERLQQFKTLLRTIEMYQFSMEDEKRTPAALIAKHFPEFGLFVNERGIWQHGERVGMLPALMSCFDLSYADAGHIFMDKGYKTPFVTKDHMVANIDHVLWKGHIKI